MGKIHQGRSSLKGTHQKEKEYILKPITNKEKADVLTYWKKCEAVNKKSAVKLTLKKFWPELALSSTHYQTKRKQLYEWRKTNIDEKVKQQPSSQVSKEHF